MRWRILWRPRKAAALKLRRRQGRESRPRYRLKRGWFHNPDPARRHPGRPTAANAAGGEMHPAPSVWCALAEGSMWAERPGFLPGETRGPSGGSGFTPCLAAGKFARSRPACGRSLCRSAMRQRVLYGPKGPVCCGDSLSDIPAAWVPIPPGSGAGQVPQRRPGPRAPPSIPVRGDGG